MKINHLSSFHLLGGGDETSSASNWPPGGGDPPPEIVSVGGDEATSVAIQPISNVIQFLANEIHSECCFKSGWPNDSKEAPNLSVDVRGAITCPSHPPIVKDDINFCTFVCYPMSNFLPIPKTFITSFTDVQINTGAGAIENVLAVESPRYKDDIVDSFGPSRLPPRVAIKLTGARKAVE